MKNKIFNYDFLIVGAGLIGSLAAIALFKKKYRVLVIEKNKAFPVDKRTLAVNASSRIFLQNIGIWKHLEKEQESIDKIVIKDSINKDDLIFQNSKESMGSVIFNRSLLKVSRNFLKKNKLLLYGIDFDSSSIKPKSTVLIKEKKYSFNKIIISLGKNYNDLRSLKRNTFGSTHKAYVGFFKHENNHNQTAYEVFTANGPLAALPSPSINKKISTFIYSTKEKMNLNNISLLIKNNFCISHGKIDLKPTISSYTINPHLSQPTNRDILLMGDTAHSIHPVAGQGWNLGIKDIQALCSCLDNYNINDLNFDKIYFSKRILVNISYLTFTNLLNFLYESNQPISKSIIKISYTALTNLPYLKSLFIKQAMGKLI